ncbi:polysaccharide export protein [Candidatus Koribacter versatilis Ellin345]|uniref:Polysaccharide export protein n=1 Tax=Koribacter versatilis (strain Ellin345) TaxID=204669 RepID=Q1ITA9_KORVE|nr:SLBB domain-containing protein [Candidatus Koribacter versatilis]ABF39891.1 polysaccharide export protein [Candidatus Koribacter versatilis Ellin345]
MRRFVFNTMLWSGFTWVLLAAMGVAQQLSTPLPAQSDITDARSSESMSLPASALINLLKQRPDLVIEIKRAAATYLQAKGMDVSEDVITDDMLFERINTDPDFRKSLTSWLWTRGYINQSDIENAALSQSNSGAEESGSTQPFDSQLPTTSNRAQKVRPSGQEPDRERYSNSASAGVQATGPAQPRSRVSEEAGDPNQPTQDGLVHQPTPLNLLALRDLYTQVPEPSSSLRRFGSDTFLQHGQSAEASIDLPAGPEYVLGPGDVLTLSMWGSISQTLPRTVDREGRIVLPEAGPVSVAGLTLEQAQALTEKMLRPQFRDVRVQLSLARVRTVRIYVVGDVQRPGAYDVSALSTVVNALFAAGGPTAIGSLRTVRHMRNKELVREVDLYDFLLRGIHADVERLEPGDTVLVPPAGRQVTVSGMVRRPAIYELRGERSIDDVVALAGGLLVSASTSQIRIERVRANTARVTDEITVKNSDDASSVRASLQAYAVEDGDRVVIAPILPYSERAIYVEGHVIRPGKIAYRDNMSVTDVIRSYRDLLPEPAERAEIIRLRPPDFRPETIEFNLSEALIGNSQIHLQPFDTIRVLGRYEFDAPKVTIQGEVLRPGTYPLPEKLTVAQLVRLAGGFKRSALKDHADLTSYDVQQGARVTSHRLSIDIGRAVDDADSAADVALKTGDVLTIHQIAGWNDIGASVTLGGEVAYPGTYGIQEGERLSSVLKRAGGFRDTAYPTGAYLSRVQVRDFEEKSRNELIRQIETTSAATKISPSLSTTEQAATLQLITQQQEQVLQRLRNQPSTGRLVIKINSDIATWEGTPIDIELRSGDVLTIPKRPGFVLVTGQVYNSTAITYVPGRDANWYLHRAGGPTAMASKKEIFVIRANGSVVGRESDESALHAKLDAGDVVVVPQKIIGGSMFWRNLLATAQFVASFAITAKVAGL